MSTVSQQKQWLQSIAKIGLIAKGTIYLLIGIMAFMAAFELGGEDESSVNQKGAFNAVQHLPGGKILLTILIAGLLCYSVWRIIECFADTEDKGKSTKGVSIRLRYLLSSLVYLSFTFVAIKVLVTNKGSGQNSYSKAATEFLSKPFGQALLVAAGIIIAAVGIYQIYYGLSGKFKKHISKLNLQKNQSAVILRAGTIGYVARGIVWLLISYLLLKAAIHTNGKEAGDTARAFTFIEKSSFGSLIIAVLGLGLLLYGVFNFIRARYDRFGS